MKENYSKIKKLELGENSKLSIKKVFQNL